MKIPEGSRVQVTAPLWKSRLLNKYGTVIKNTKFGDCAIVKFDGNTATSRVYLKTLTVVADPYQRQPPGYDGC